MSYEDPFNNAPAEEAQAVPAEQSAPVGTVKVAVKPVLGDLEVGGKVTTTFKGGRDFDAPWIVIHSATVEEAIETVKDTDKLKELFQLTQSGATFFASLGGGSKPASGGGAPAQQTSRAPQGATEAPGGEKRYCDHGEMVFKSGVSKAGNPYKLFSCTAPRNSQCKAQYLN